MSNATHDDTAGTNSSITHPLLADRLLLRPSEAAKLLGLGRNKVYELCQARELPSIRIGTAVRIPVDELRDWIKLNRE